MKFLWSLVLLGLGFLLANTGCANPNLEEDFVAYCSDPKPSLAKGEGLKKLFLQVKINVSPPYDMQTCTQAYDLAKTLRKLSFRESALELDLLSFFPDVLDLNLDNSVGNNNYAVLKKLTKLQHLSFANGKASDISFLNSLTDLRSLNLGGNPVAEGKPAEKSHVLLPNDRRRIAKYCFAQTRNVNA